MENATTQKTLLGAVAPILQKLNMFKWIVSGNNGSFNSVLNL